jgi:hypothetical protein
MQALMEHYPWEQDVLAANAVLVQTINWLIFWGEWG